jgi:hypothetical protein
MTAVGKLPRRSRAMPPELLKRELRTGKICVLEREGSSVPDKERAHHRDAGAI